MAGSSAGSFEAGLLMIHALALPVSILLAGTLSAVFALNF